MGTKRRLSFNDLSVSDQAAVMILRKRSDASILELLRVVTHLTAAGYSPQDIAMWSGRSFDWACRYIVLGNLDIAILSLVRQEWSLSRRDLVKKQQGRRAVFPLSTAIEAAKLPPHEQLSFVQERIRQNVMRQTVASRSNRKRRNVPSQFCVRMNTDQDLEDWLRSYESLSPDDLAAILETCSPVQRQSLIARAQNIFDQLNHLALTTPQGASLAACHLAIRDWFRQQQRSWWQSQLPLEQWMDQNEEVFGSKNPVL